jgi:hypothetical protein
LLRAHFIKHLFNGHFGRHFKRAVTTVAPIHETKGFSVPFLKRVEFGDNFLAHQDG